MISKGDGLSTRERVVFDDQKVSFQVDGDPLLAEVPEGSGTVALTVEGAGGESGGFITIE